MSNKKPSSSFSITYNYTASSNFDLSGVQGQPSSNFDFGSAEPDVTTLYPIGFNLTRYGSLLISYGLEAIKPNSIVPPNTGVPTIINTATQIVVSGISQPQFNKPLIYNLLGVLSARGFESLSYGEPFLQGGVKYLSPRSLVATIYGSTLVVNTTANQTIKPTGIYSQAMSPPDVSPRMLYAKQFIATLFGLASASKTPMIEPLGLDQSIYGSSNIWFRVRPIVGIDGINSYDTGYPVVYDPAQEIQAPSLLTSAIFGDTAVRNERRLLQPTSIFEEVVEQWAIVTNSNRYIALSGINSQAHGEGTVFNKTPSILFSGISSLAFGEVGIGYSIRSVGPSGFDRLLLGKPTLTKTPELAPESFNTSAVSSLFISHRIRAVRADGFIATLFGGHVAWYRYRYVGPASWLSSKFSKANLTHGVREVIGQGFVREVHGRLWISQGTRHIEPTSINKIYSSLHMVGGSREVKPTGFIATEFGTRIIPENTYAYPQGFAGTFGLSAIRLNTQHLRPLGFISVGQQPADRWGYAKAYNLTQYIIQVQNFDRDNGLIPPAWSEWSLIENRDKQLNVTGFNSLKIGYNKIDNNAAALLPLGIEPPVSTRYDVSMIAHGVRYINGDGISAPIVSSWLVIYNDARVIKPIGFIDARTGLASAENTRRYYSGVGRFESLEAGVPMVSYAIRHILLEPRYAIMPPQINLPTIDVLTKYATFRGFETAAYGTPSLTIRFNIIDPKWVYRDKVGDPYINNLTPEVATYGHNSEDFGVAGVRTQWRIIYARGDTLTLFGISRISDKRLYVQPTGWRDTVLSQKHVVVRTGAPPYSEQKISLDGWYNYDKDEYVNGFGIAWDKQKQGERVPEPGVNQNVLYPDGYIATIFGANRIWSNNIHVFVGIAIHNVPDTHKVYNKTTNVVLTENHAIKTGTAFGMPRMSPLTIWAVKEAPRQAIENHKKFNLHYIGETNLIKPGVQFGRVKVESTIRSLKPVWIASTEPPINWYGTPVVELARREIKPSSFGSIKFGIPVIPFTDQGVQVFTENTKPQSIVGKPDIAISDMGVRYIRHYGISELAIPLPTVQLYTRELSTKGHDSLVMGSRKSGDRPFMWQGLRVGAHVPLIIGGDDMSAFGEGMVSLRIRGINLEGWESFISEYDTANFNERMKISHARQPDIQSQRVSIDGFVATDYGNADFKFGQYFIRPDGNSDQFRKGGYHA